VEKGFGLIKSEEREERRAQRKKEGGVKPPLRGFRPLSGYGDRRA